MAGLYIHIPFCRKACHYCNFHFSTSFKLKTELVEAIANELHLQQNYLNKQTINSIYLGGGTPSVLNINELNIIFDKIYQIHNVSPQAEITLEANPDDLNGEFLQNLKKYTPVNRLSIGIQSFSEEDLRWMNRAHNAIEARSCIEYAQDAGFDNLTVDLIYGAPTTSDEQWLKNLQIIFDYDIPHISCYALTVEDDTALSNFIKKGKRPAINDENAARQFEILQDEMKRNAFLQYEISNFAQPDKFAKHNTNYWFGVPYLGIGPAAHSFNGTSRQWNIANNPQYIRSIANEKVPFTHENLTVTQQYNEYVMTSLRTMWGSDPITINEKFGKQYLKYFNQKIIQHIQNKNVVTDGKKYFLTDKGKLFADRIAMELFF